MNLLRRVLISAAIGISLLVAGCAATAPAVDPAVTRVLAPTGTLRVGVYPGSPTSLVVNPKTGERAGVALELGQALGKQLGCRCRWSSSVGWRWCSMR
jgi:polar amino acid transport system substrate-binding protein